ncbi:MAG: type II toxin-antitoxin system Phd/YefM family antitoxin [Victivallales bacterium]|nr:type II toxin-antitoxin system Phd/YefM family antitoxin [Victivallales bacterium]
MQNTALKRNIWPLQDAKARFSELVNEAISHGPQLVTRRGRDAVVVIAADEYRAKTPNSPFDFFRGKPYLDDLKLQRDRQPARKVEL